MGAAVSSVMGGGTKNRPPKPPPEPPRVPNPATEKDRLAVDGTTATAERRRATGSAKRSTALTGGGLLTSANTARKTALGA